MLILRLRGCLGVLLFRALLPLLLRRLLRRGRLLLLVVRRAGQLHHLREGAGASVAAGRRFAALFEIYTIGALCIAPSSKWS